MLNQDHDLSLTSTKCWERLNKAMKKSNFVLIFQSKPTEIRSSSFIHFYLLLTNNPGLSFTFKIDFKWLWMDLRFPDLVETLTIHQN